MLWLRVHNQSLKYTIFKRAVIALLLLCISSSDYPSMANPFDQPSQVNATAFNTNPTPVPTRAVQAGIVYNDYVLDAGDIVEITDENMGSVSSNVRILSDGSIHLKLVGAVRLGGMTVSGAVQHLNELYKTYFVDPNLSIQLNYQRPSRIYVKGAVSSPGVYVSGNTLGPKQLSNARLGGADTQSIYYKLYLTDVLIMAGGLAPTANLGDVTITRTRPKRQKIHVNLWEMFNGEEVVQDIGLSDRDVITIGTISEEDMMDEANWHKMDATNIAAGVFKINVIGAVKSPGSYDASAKDSVFAAIAKAGGFNELAQKNDVYLLRPLPNGQILRKKLDFKDKDLKQSKKKKKKKDDLNTLLRPNDMVLVQESGMKKIGKFSAGLLNKASSAAFLPLFNQMINTN